MFTTLAPLILFHLSLRVRIIVMVIQIPSVTGLLERILLKLQLVLVVLILVLRKMLGIFWPLVIIMTTVPLVRVASFMRRFSLSPRSFSSPMRITRVLLILFLILTASTRVSFATAAIMWGIVRAKIVVDIKVVVTLLLMIVIKLNVIIKATGCLL